MKVILLQELDHLGDEGDIVTVKDGYGRNYLIPRGLARLATDSAIKAWTEERRQAARKLAQRKGDAERMATEMGKIELVIQAKVGEENRIFGSVTSQQIADALMSEGIVIDRRKIELNEDIRHIGVYTASIKIHPEVTAEVKVRVEPEGGVEALLSSQPDAPASEVAPGDESVPAESDDDGAEVDEEDED